MPRVVSIKKMENHTTLLQGPLKGKENRTLLQKPPLSYPLKPGISDAYRCTPPTPTPTSEHIAKSLHRKIQIVSRAVRLLEHKLRGKALLSVSNILSIIHKEEEKIKRLAGIEIKYLTAWLTQQLHMA